eukprot:748472-Hanusia_phi.AAC.1
MRQRVSRSYLPPPRMKDHLGFPCMLPSSPLTASSTPLRHATIKASLSVETSLTRPLITVTLPGPPRPGSGVGWLPLPKGLTFRVRDGRLLRQYLSLLRDCPE